MLRIKNLTKAFGSNVLLNNANLAVQSKDRVAILGQNASGKSTLFKCILGDEDYTGTIELAPNTKVSAMAQEQTFEEEKENFLSYLNSKKGKIDQKIKEVEQKLGDSIIFEDPELYCKVLSDYEALCARTTENIEEVKIKDILKQLDFELEEFNKPIITLSGGQRTKLRLAECLSKKADLYLLDEPTNHLDLSTRKWLENYLKNLDATLLIISHDRFFVNKLANSCVEIEDAQLVRYQGSYNQYLSQKVIHLENLQKHYDDNERERARLQASLTEKNEWLKKGKMQKIKTQIEHLQRRIDNLPKLNDPSQFNSYFELAFRSGPKPSSIIFEAHNLSFNYGEHSVLDKVSFDVRINERVAIVGNNGTGKSTLLKILAGKYKVDNLGIADIKVGYFDQEFKDMPPSMRVLEYLNEIHYGPEHQLIAFIIKLGFPKDKLRDRINVLSGGEKARLSFARLMLSQYNVLLLDEPTNNIDLELLEGLEEAIKNFDGTVIFISHDRYFMDKIATKLFWIRHKNIEILEGKYSDFF